MFRLITNVLIYDHVCRTEAQGAPATTGSSSGGGAGDKVKTGFGKFMTGLDKWANKTADSMAKQMEKVGIKDN